jgi:tetratricopeptide (TPR) repeat protein
VTTPLRACALGLLLVVAAGCGGTPSYPVTRRLDGERVEGSFVSPFSYEHYVRAELAIARGDLESAAEELTLTRAGPEEDPLVLARLADVLDMLDRHDEADGVLADATERFPDAEAVWLARAHIAARRGHVEDATEAYLHAAEAAPRSSTAPLELARLLRDRGAEGRADAVLDAYLARSRGTAGAYRAKMELALARDDVDGAVRAVRALLAVAPARVSEIVAVATTALEAGRPVLAAALLDAVPRGQAPAGLRVQAFLAAGRTEAAEAALVTMRDEDLGGPLVRARFLLEAGRAARALEIAEGQALLAPDPEAWLVTGEALLALGRVGEAAAALGRVPKGASGHAEAHRALARALETGGLPGMAAEVLETGLDGREGEDLRTRAALAELRLARGDVDAALEAVDGNESPSARARRARLVERAGRFDDAIAAWRRVPVDAHELDERSRLRARAERLVRRGRAEGAIHALRRVVALAPDDIESRARLAELLAREGRADDARAVARAARALTNAPALRARLDAIAGP